jgi:hypothetical protein
MAGEALRARLTGVSGSLAPITSGIAPRPDAARPWCRTVLRTVPFRDAGACIPDGRLRWAEGVAPVPGPMAEVDATKARKAPADNVITEHVAAREAPNDAPVFALCLALFGPHAEWARRTPQEVPAPIIPIPRPRQPGAGP